MRQQSLAGFFRKTEEFKDIKQTETQKNIFSNQTNEDSDEIIKVVKRKKLIRDIEYDSSSEKNNKKQEDSQYQGSESSFKELPAKKNQRKTLPVKLNEKKVIISKQPKSAPQQKIDEPMKNLDEEEIGGGFQSFDEIKDALPDFLKEENIKDKDGRIPTDPDYDETTLFIPKDKWSTFTPAMTQYWKIKENNQEKILFFKLGKFYEIFFLDAIVCQKLLDLNWMGGAKKLHVGFPEKALDKYLEIMVTHGFKVAVVEQTETPRQLEKRQLEEKKSGVKADKCIQREIIEIVTRGSFARWNQQNSQNLYLPKYILSYKKVQNDIGVCFLDVQTYKIFIGQFKEPDASSLQVFRTLITQIRPVEVIQERDPNLSQVEKIFKNSPIVPTFQRISSGKCMSVFKVKDKLSKYFQTDQVDKWPETFKIITQSLEDTDLAFQSLGLVITFLEDALIADKVIGRGFYHLYQPEQKAQQNADYLSNQFVYSQEYMIMDSQCLQHLEIVEQQSGVIDGSLLSFVDHCCTPFGKRELKSWVMRPLICVEQINDRLDAIEDINNDTFARDCVRAKFRKLPDIERLIGKILSYSVQNNNKVIYFEDVSLIKLKEFKTLLTALQNSIEFIDDLVQNCGKFKSKRLQQLLFTDQQEVPGGSFKGLFPSNLIHEIQTFEELIVWKKIGDKDIPEPKKGIDQAFDSANETVDVIKSQLNSYLAEVKKRFNRDSRIQFSHAKYRYELEIPSELVNGAKKPDDFEFTSARSGFERFHTKKIKGFVDELEQAEEQLKSAMQPFLTAIFTQFFEKRVIWEGTLRVITEIDCLISLAVTSQEQSGVMCRPILIPYEGEFENKAYFEVKEMRHPCVFITNGSSFIPNDTKINTHDQGLLLVTGPNMGGKSTLLRQNCLAAILAQLGCFVPASYCALTPVDRIFTRLGASDQILEGKSTFYVEMEETKNVLKYGTFKSLAILDELGRGTSTFDGYSLAHSVLNYLINKIQCRCLFSTHYHMLLDEFRDKKGIAMYHMAFQVQNKKQKQDVEQITFLYKFIKGECPQSFGLNVAKMAGLPPSILQNALKMSKQFQENILCLKLKIQS